MRFRFYGRIRQFENSTYILIPAAHARKLLKDWPDLKGNWFPVEVEL